MKKALCVIFLSIVFSGTFSQNVNQLIAKAEKDVEMNHWERAYADLNRLMDYQEDNLTYLQKAQVYNILGYLNLMFLDPEEAELDLNRSLLYHEEAGIPNQKSYASALVNTSMLYLEQVEFDLAREYIKKALEILKQDSDYYVDYLIARTKLARVYEEAGSYTLALSIYNESYDKLVALGNELSPDFADICSHKGRILMLTGDPIEGERFINLSATIYESLGDQYNVQRAESMEDLALFYERMGRYGEAEGLLLKILELKRSIPDEADILIIETLNDLGIMYNDLGKFDQAEVMFNDVIRECKESVGEEHPFYATAKNNLGTIALSRGHYQQAKVLLEDALKKYEAKFGSFHPYYANALNNLARTERKLGNTYQAEKYYYEVLEIDLKLFGEEHPNYATTLLNIGILLSASNREEGAAEYYEKVLEIREKALGTNHPAYGSALEYLGLHYLAMGEIAKAEKSFRMSIEIQINLIRTLFPIMTESERELFYRQVKEKVSRYHFLASQLLDQNHALIEHIFDFQVKTKTLLFNTLDKVKDIVSESDDEILVAKYQKWLSDKRLLASYYQMGVDQLAELHVNLEKIEVDIENQERVLAENIEAFEEVLPQDNLNWEYVLKSVKDDESIVEIIKIKEFKALIKDRENLFGFTDKTSYLAIIFNSGSEKVHYTFLGKRNLKEIDHLVVSQNSEEAYDSYWRPVMEKTNETKWIRLIPDGIFSKINPNQYRIDQKNYVIDKKYVTYLTSVHDLFRPDVATFIEKFCLIQNPTFDESTLESLSRYHFVERPTLEFIFSNWRINTYDRQDASEFRLRTTYNPTILHISAPVFLESQKPFISDKSGLSELLFNSGIYLSGVSDSYDKYGKGISSIPENDGLLMIDEVMKLELERTRLVFLSSVELEREKVNGGDGYYGLLRAFSVAGVRNVITSTAIVDEAKKNELIELFYQRFLETDQIQASFRYAQLEIKKKYEDANVWGAFIVTGSGS